MQCVAVCCSVLQCAAVHPHHHQRVAVCCIVLQCVAVCCRMCCSKTFGDSAVCCRMCCSNTFGDCDGSHTHRTTHIVIIISKLQRAALYCRVLQCVAECVAARPSAIAQCVAVCVAVCVAATPLTIATEATLIAPPASSSSSACSIWSNVGRVLRRNALFSDS